MSLDVDLFWSFRSPYSYLATGRAVALAREHEVEIAVRPVLPLAVRVPDFFERVNPLWPPYVLRDIKRIADWLGIGIGWPRPDPIVQDFATRRVAPEQPYIFRLTRLGVAAARRGRGLAFIDEVSKLIWDGRVDGWNQGDHLAGAAKRAGLSLADLDQKIEAESGSYDAEIEQNQKDLEAAGHWGVPTFAFRGEPFFGQDRIELLTWRLQQAGLRERASR